MVVTDTGIEVAVPEGGIEMVFDGWDETTLEAPPEPLDIIEDIAAPLARERPAARTSPDLEANMFDLRDESTDKRYECVVQSIISP